MSFSQLNELVLAVFIAMAFVLSGCGSGSDEMVSRSPAGSIPLIETPPDDIPDSDLGSALAVGFYTSGSVRSSEKFPDSGVGYSRIFLARNRGWTTRSMINLVAKGAADVVAVLPNGGRIQVGDASNVNGGTAGGHASHQNGLDVDLRYYAVDQREQSPNSTSGFDENFVRNGVVTANFDLERNWAFISSIVSTGKVARIFMDPALKTALCAFKTRPGATEVLRRMRPYTNHANHMHVRIKCPANSPNCTPQAEVAAGNGCSSINANEIDEFGDDQEI